jgi:CrcB protein
MSSALAQACAVALGGAAGALLRHGINLLLPKSTQHAFSISTLSVNVVGCFLAGLLLVWVMQRSEIDFWRALLLTGLLGGLTTFSAFGLDLLQLVRTERWSWLALTVLLHVVLGLAAVVAGWRIGQSAWPTL